MLWQCLCCFRSKRNVVLGSPIKTTELHKTASSHSGRLLAPRLPEELEQALRAELAEALRELEQARRDRDWWTSHCRQKCLALEQEVRPRGGSRAFWVVFSGGRV